MSTLNKPKLLLIFCCIIFLLGSSGCDKLSFLSDYFPSLKKKEEPKAEPKKKATAKAKAKAEPAAKKEAVQDAPAAEKTGGDEGDSE